MVCALGQLEASPLCGNTPVPYGTVRWPYLLNEVDALLQVHAEVNELPLDAFLAVLFLLEDEHVMVEELLKTLVRVVDAQLLERVVLVTSTTTTNTTTLNQTSSPGRVTQTHTSFLHVGAS